MANLSAAAELLDYLQPACLFATFIAVVIFDWLTLRTAATGEKATRGRRTAITFTFLVFLTFAGQVILNLVQALQHRKWGIEEHCIIGTLGNMYIWGVLSGALITFENPVWDPFAACWLLSAAFEVTMIGVAVPETQGRTPFDIIRMTLQALRIALLFMLIINMTRIRYRTKRSDPENEQEPLLNGHANGSADPTYGATKPAENEAEEVGKDPDKELREAQRKRLEQHGGWIGYIKEFKIFIPYLVPFKNRKVQACVAIIVINILFDRFINVMVPRQMGIITDRLAKDYTIMPWREVLVWVVLRWSNSFASFGLISDIAHTYLHNWSSAQIKGLAFRHVMSLSMDFHSNKDSGDLIKSIGQADSLNDLLETIFFQIMPILLDVFIAFAYISYLFNGAMAMVFTMVGTMFIWTSITTTTRVRPKRRVYTEKSRAESKTMYECVSNWPTISYFNRTTFEEDRYKNSVREEMNAQLNYYVHNSLGYAVQYLIIYSGLLTVSMMAIFQISEGRKPIGNFVTLVMYWASMMSPLHMITYQYRRISGATVDAERLLQLLQTEPTVKSKPGAKPLTVEKGEVRFNHVSFAYDDRKKTLSDLNFTVEPGQTVAFVGETGGGKSTTLKLLFRFYDVKEGSIVIDGQDIRDVALDSLRQELGVVPQDPSLWNQTIMENVRYGRLDATEDEVIEACRAAAVHDKIMTFPDGYKSKVGERGVKLSGGELQRVAIARVILKNPKIVLLDEATSAVDSSIEAQIQAAFKKLSTGRTTFVVAHRLSTIMEADLILVIDQGEIIERGTHAQLIDQGKKYFELWTKQTAGNASNVPSKAPSLLDIPHDIKPALTNDLPTATYNEQINDSSLIDLDEEKETDLGQFDGACFSKSLCTGNSSKDETQEPQRAEGKRSSSSSSDDDDQEPIKMVSAKPTFSTIASVPSVKVSSPNALSAEPHKGLNGNSSSSMNVEAPNSVGDSLTKTSEPDTRRSSHVGTLSDEAHVRKVTVASAHPSSASSYSASLQESNNSSQTSGPPVEKKRISERKPTGYPRDMPGATGSSSDDSSSTAEEAPAEKDDGVSDRSNERTDEEDDKSHKDGNGLAAFAKRVREESSTSGSQDFGTPTEELTTRD